LIGAREYAKKNLSKARRTQPPVQQEHPVKKSEAEINTLMADSDQQFPIRRDDYLYKNCSLLLQGATGRPKEGEVQKRLEK